jgi:stress-induced morphogen
MNPAALRARLSQNFPDSAIQVEDLTGTEDHYQVEIESSRFQGLSRIQMHKMVMDVFGPELKTGEVHALTIKAKPK